MAVLNRDEFFSRMQERIGTDTSDEAISFLEDMTDTYNDMENRANGDGEDWKRKYEENDAAWKAKYRHRFFSGDSRVVGSEVESVEDDGAYHADEVTVEDLFEEKEGK